MLVCTYGNISNKLLIIKNFRLRTNYLVARPLEPITFHVNNDGDECEENEGTDRQCQLSAGRHGRANDNSLVRKERESGRRGDPFDAGVVAVSGVQEAAISATVTRRVASIAATTVARIAAVDYEHGPRDLPAVALIVPLQQVWVIVRVSRPLPVSVPGVMATIPAIAATGFLETFLERVICKRIVRVLRPLLLPVTSMPAVVATIPAIAATAFLEAFLERVVRVSRPLLLLRPVNMPAGFVATIPAIATTWFLEAFVARIMRVLRPPLLLLKKPILPLGRFTFALRGHTKNKIIISDNESEIHAHHGPPLKFNNST